MATKQKGRPALAAYHCRALQGRWAISRNLHAFCSKTRPYVTSTLSAVWRVLSLNPHMCSYRNNIQWRDTHRHPITILTPSKGDSNTWHDWYIPAKLAKPPRLCTRTFSGAQPNTPRIRTLATAPTKRRGTDRYTWYRPADVRTSKSPQLYSFGTATTDVATLGVPSLGN